MRATRYAAVMAVDRGLTHVALPVASVDVSVDFYRRYADMDVVHRRRDAESGTEVVWISDRTRPFVIVLIEQAPVEGGLRGYAHLGVGCDSREQVDERCARAQSEGRAVFGPLDSGYPVGYWAIIPDPDGHNLELSHGQEVALTVEHSR